MNYIDEEKQTRTWSNDLVGRVLFLDKYTAEDCQEFQGMEFEVIDGYYFNEGWNKQIKTQVEAVFKKRPEAKNNGNTCLANACKLLLNSSYGKLIQKTPTTEQASRTLKKQHSKAQRILRHCSCNPIPTLGPN